MRGWSELLELLGDFGQLVSEPELGGDWEGLVDEVFEFGGEFSGAFVLGLDGFDWGE